MSAVDDYPTLAFRSGRVERERPTPALYSEREVKALDHCYASADAAGMDWTTEGWISCSASNICGLLQRAGSPPPTVKPSERLDPDAVSREWNSYDDEEAIEFATGRRIADVLMRMQADFDVHEARTAARDRAEAMRAFLDDSYEVAK